MENQKTRVDWVDYAKGICIILVVLMHSTLGVEKASGTLSSIHGFIEWAKPFRMPDFFLLSGLFLASRINYPWRKYLDTKVVHFAYFYILWMFIQIVTKDLDFHGPNPALDLVQNFLWRFLIPSSTLWFIYVLLIFFVVAKLVKPLPMAVVFVFASALEILHHMGFINTGYLLIDEFAGRFVYFFVGYWLAPVIFKFASAISNLRAGIILGGLVAWGLLNTAAVYSTLAFMPVFSLVFGFAGAGAVIATGVLLSKFKWAEALRYCGENSIVIYLSFFLFMASVRTITLRFAPNLDLSVVALLTTFVSVIGPILLFWGVRNTSLRFLFVRPKWARIK